MVETVSSRKKASELGRPAFINTAVLYFHSVHVPPFWAATLFGHGSPEPDCLHVSRPLCTPRYDVIDQYTNSDTFLCAVHRPVH